MHIEFEATFSAAGGRRAWRMAREDCPATFESEAQRTGKASKAQEYRAIRELYAGRFAQRSGVPLLLRLEEGVIVLGKNVASEKAMRPLFPADDDRMRHGRDFIESWWSWNTVTRPMRG